MGWGYFFYLYDTYFYFVIINAKFRDFIKTQSYINLQMYNNQQKYKSASFSDYSTK